MRTPRSPGMLDISNPWPPRLEPTHDSTCDCSISSAEAALAAHQVMSGGGGASCGQARRRRGAQVDAAVVREAERAVTVARSTRCSDVEVLEDSVGRCEAVTRSSRTA